MTKIKWIFFDIDNTLFDSKEMALRCRKNAIKAMVDMGLKAEEEEAYEKLKRIIKKQGSNSDNHFNELVDYYNNEKKRRIIAAGLVAYHNTKQGYLMPFEDVTETLIDLSKDYKLGIISNGMGVKQWEKLIRLGLVHFFEVVMISEEVEIEKPDKGIFEKALDAGRCKPGEAVMIGDRADDIKPANEIGMHTISVNEKVRGKHNVTEFKNILNVVRNLG